jgi:hypothetical protein
MRMVGPGNLAPADVRNPDRTAISESTDLAIPAALNAEEDREITYPNRALNHDSSDTLFVLLYTHSYNTRIKKRRTNTAY